MSVCCDFGLWSLLRSYMVTKFIRLEVRPLLPAPKALLPASHRKPESPNYPLLCLFLHSQPAPPSQVIPPRPWDISVQLRDKNKKRNSYVSYFFEHLD